MDRTPRLATPDDAAEAAGLLHDFNREFDWPSPGADVLAQRLLALLAGDETFAVLAGEPASAVAVVTLRPNVWYDGPVAQRFYRRQGFSEIESETGERAFYFSQEFTRPDEGDHDD